MSNDLVYALAYDVTGVAMKLHTALGPDHRELIYQRGMLYRLQDAGYAVDSHPVLPLNDDGHSLVDYEGDLRVTRDGVTILIELKADPAGIQKSDFRQARAYLSVSAIDQAVLLLNFGTRSLEHKPVYKAWRRR